MTFTSLFAEREKQDEISELRNILSRVAMEYSLSLSDLRSDCRFKAHSIARRSAAVAAREAGYGPTAIARCMFKDQASVYDMLKRAEGETEEDRKAQLMTKAKRAPRVVTPDFTPWETVAREQDRRFVQHMFELYPRLYTGGRMP
jgi:chromosomal replication initiation ATPase DnaA